MRCGCWGRAKGLSLVARPDLLADVAKLKLDYDPTEATRPPEGFYYLEEEPARSSIVCQPAFEFLERRGVTAEKRERAKIGVALSGKYFGRIIIPVLADDGETWIGWMGRSWVKNAQLRYIYPKGLPRGSCYYNSKALLVETDVPVLICEGALDTQFQDDAVACLGKPSHEQLDALLEAKRPVVLCLDGDAFLESWAHMMRLRTTAAMLGRTLRVGCLRLAPSTDPGELNWGELRKAARELAFD